jgi:preprotein translocase subunit SecD
MKKNLQWKVVLSLVVIGGSIFLAYPFNDTKIKRGLDLKGGIHLVLQVITDDSINMETDQEISRIEELLKKNAITYQKVLKEGLGRISVQGTLADQEGKTRDLFDQYSRDWDLSFAGDRANLTLKPLVVQFLRDQSVSQAKETIDNRVNGLGVAEPLIQRQGSDKIVVELPGVDNPERVKELIKVTAVLEWKLVKAGPAADEATLLQATNGVVPDDGEILRGDPKRGQGGFYLVNKVAVVTGKDLRTIRRTQDEWNNPAVSFSLNSDGGARFELVTGDNIGKQIAIILDKKVQSAPVVEARIQRAQGGVIQGRFTAQEADDLVVILKAGALPAPSARDSSPGLWPSLRS